MKRIIFCLLFFLSLTHVAFSQTPNLVFYGTSATPTPNASIYPNVSVNLLAPQVRIFQIGNTGGSYNGDIKFEDQSGASIGIINLKYRIYNSITDVVNLASGFTNVTLLAGSGPNTREATLSGLTIGAGQKIVFVEEFQLNTCPPNGSDQSSIKLTQLPLSGGSSLITDSYNITTGDTYINPIVNIASDPIYTINAISPRTKPICSFNGNNYPEARESVVFEITKSDANAIVHDPLMLFINNNQSSIVIIPSTIQIQRINTLTNAVINTYKNTLLNPDLRANYVGTITDLHLPPITAAAAASLATPNTDFFSTVQIQLPNTPGDIDWVANEKLIVRYDVLRLCNSERVDGNFSEKRSETESFVMQIRNNCNTGNITTSYGFGTPGSIGFSGYYIERPTFMAAPGFEPLVVSAPLTKVPDLARASLANLLNKEHNNHFFGFGEGPNPMDPNGGLGYNYNVAHSELVVVLRTEQGLKYSGFNEITNAPFPGVVYPYNLRAPANAAASVPCLRFIDKINPTQIWLPINPDGLGSYPDLYTTTSVFNYTDSRVFRFDMSAFPGASGISTTNPREWTYQMKKALLEYINRSTLDYSLESDCPSTDGPHYQLEFYININTTDNENTPSNADCTDCLLPLFQINRGATVNCPGCLVAGGAGKGTTIERINYGFEDLDNNGKPDGTTSATSSTPGVRKNYGIVGDEFLVNTNYYLTDGAQQCGTETSPSDTYYGFENTYLDIDFPLGMFDIPNQLMTKGGITNNFTFTIRRAGVVIATYNDSVSNAILNNWLILKKDASGNTIGAVFWGNVNEMNTKLGTSISTFRSGDQISISFHLVVSENKLLPDPINEAIFIAHPYFSVNQVLDLSTGTFDNNTTKVSDLKCANNTFTPSLSNPIYDILQDGKNTRFECEGFEFNLFVSGVYSEIIGTGKNIVPGCSPFISHILHSNIGFVESPIDGGNFLNIFTNEVRFPPMTDKITFTAPAGFAPNVELIMDRDGIESGRVVHGRQEVLVNNLTPTTSIVVGGITYNNYTVDLGYLVEPNSNTFPSGVQSVTDFFLPDETSLLSCKINLVPSCDGSFLAPNTNYPIVPQGLTPPDQYDPLFEVGNYNVPNFDPYPGETTSKIIKNNNFEDGTTNFLKRPDAPLDVQATGSAGGTSITISNKNFIGDFRIHNNSASVAPDFVFLSFLTADIDASKYNSFDLVYANGTPVPHQVEGIFTYYLFGKIDPNSDINFQVRGELNISNPTNFICDGTTSGGITDLPFRYGWNCINDFSDVNSICQVFSPTAFTYNIVTARLDLDDLIVDQTYKLDNCGKIKYTNTLNAPDGAMDNIRYNIALPSNFSLDNSSVVINFGVNLNLGTDYTITAVTSTNYNIDILPSVFSNRLFIGNTALGVAPGQLRASTIEISFIVNAPSACTDYDPFANNQTVLTVNGKRYCGSSVSPLSTNGAINNQFRFCNAPIVSIDSTVICQGGYALSSTVTNGTGSYSYQWRSSADGNSWTVISGATGPSYNASPTGPTYYSVVVTDVNQCQAISNSILLDQSICGNIELTKCTHTLIKSINNLLQFRQPSGVTDPDIQVNSAACTPYSIVKLNELHPKGGGFGWYTMPLDLDCNFPFQSGTRTKLINNTVDTADFANGALPTGYAGEKYFGVTLDDIYWDDVESSKGFLLRWSNSVRSGFDYMGICSPEPKYIIENPLSQEALEELYEVAFYVPVSGPYDYYSPIFGSFTTCASDLVDKSNIKTVSNPRLAAGTCSTIPGVDYLYSGADIIVDLEYLSPPPGSPAVVQAYIKVLHGNGTYFQYKQIISSSCTPVCNFQASAGPDQTICAGGKASLQVTTTGGAFPYTYSWTPTAGLNYANGPTIIATPTATTAYSVTVTDAFGCSATDDVIVNYNSMPTPTADANVDQTICLNATTNLNGIIGGSATGGAWSSSGTGTFVPNNTTLGAVYVPSMADISAGYVTLTLATTGNGICAVGSDDMKLTFVSSPSPTADANSDQTICAGADATLNGIVGGSATGGIWSSSGSGTFSPNSATLGAQYIPSAADKIAGNVTLTLTTIGSGACPPSSDAMVLFINQVPAITISNPAPVCSPSTVDITLAAVTAGSTPGLTYTYWTDANATIPYSTPLAATAGTYYIKGTDGSTCFKISPVTVVVNALPIINVTNPASVCAPNKVNLTLSSVTAGSTPTSGLTFSYWTDVNCTNPLSAPSNLDISGTYYIKGTDGSTCSKISPVTVVVNALPTVSAGTDKSICPGESVTLNGSGAQNYTWDENVNNNAAFFPTVTKPYTVTGTDANGCSNTDQVIVTVKPEPTILSVFGASRCGQGVLTLSAIPSNLATVKWFANLTDVSSVATGNSYLPNVTTTTTFYVSSELDGCSTLQRTPVVATVGTITPTILSTGSGTQCYSGQVQLSATASNQASVNWYNASSGGTPLSTGNSYLTTTITATTAYWVEATLNGCTSSTRTMVLANIASPAVNSVSGASRCGPGQVTLSASGNGGMYWYTASSGGSSLYTGASYTTPSISSSTTYYVEAAYSGCTMSSRVPVTVTIKPLPTVSSTVGPTGKLCGGTNITLKGVGTGTPPLTYSWSGGITDGVPFQRGSGTTNYVVTVTDGNNCTNTNTQSVTVNSGTATDITMAATKSVCASASSFTINPTVSGGNNNSTYQWIPNTGMTVSGSTSLNPTITTTTNLTYTLVVTRNSNSCVNTASCAVTLNNSCKTGEQEEEMVEIIEITPNPSEDNFNLMVHSREKKTLDVIVLDMNGRLIQETKATTNESYRFGAEYSAGVYVLKVVNDGKIETFKIVKLK